MICQEGGAPWFHAEGAQKLCIWVPLRRHSVCLVLICIHYKKIVTMCIVLFWALWVSLSELLNLKEVMCYRLEVRVAPKFTLKPNPPVWCYWRIEGHEAGALMNGISVLSKDHTELPRPFCHMRTQQEDSRLWTRKQFLARHWIFQRLDLGVPAFRTVGNKCLLSRLPSLWCICYSSPD